MAKQTGSKSRSVRGSRTGRPIMALLDLLGRRWSLRILWELRGAPLTSRRRLHGKPAGKPAVRYYVLSKYIPAKRFLQVVRSHWSIENQLHWVLDVVFGEDACRTRKDNGPENFATLRRNAVNLIRAHPARISMRQKVKRAGWEDAFLLQLISHMR